MAALPQVTDVLRYQSVLLLVCGFVNENLSLNLQLGLLDALINLESQRVDFAKVLQLAIVLKTLNVLSMLENDVSLLALKAPSEVGAEVQHVFFALLIEIFYFVTNFGLLPLELCLPQEGEVRLDVEGLRHNDILYWEELCHQGDVQHKGRHLRWRVHPEALQEGVELVLELQFDEEQDGLHFLKNGVEVHYLVILPEQIER